MVNYNVTFGDEETMLACDDFESIEEVGAFIEECLVEHGQGEWQVVVAAFESDEDEVLVDEP